VQTKLVEDATKKLFFWQN